MEWERSSFSHFYPSLPSSLPPTCSHFHFSLLQVVGVSHLKGFIFLSCIWSSLLNFYFLFLPYALKFEYQPLKCCSKQLLLQLAVVAYLVSLSWTLRSCLRIVLFCASGKLFCIETKKNVLQRFCFSSWFLCLHFRGCVDKPWCCPRNQSPWEYAMLNSK